MRRVVRVSTFLFLSLLLAGCTAIPFLYVNNETNTKALILVDWGDGAKNFSVGPNKWTEFELPMASFSAENITVSVKDETRSGYELENAFASQYTSSGATVFVRLDSTGLHRSGVPFWYRARTIGQIALFFLPTIVVTLLICFVARTIFRFLMPKRRVRKV